MMRHLQLPLDPNHFERWLTLFAETATELLPPPIAAAVIANHTGSPKTSSSASPTSNQKLPQPKNSDAVAIHLHPVAIFSAWLAPKVAIGPEPATRKPKKISYLAKKKN